MRALETSGPNFLSDVSDGGHFAKSMSNIQFFYMLGFRIGILMNKKERGVQSEKFVKKWAIFGTSR